MYRLFDEIMSRLFGDAWRPALSRLADEGRVFARRIVWHPLFERTIIALIIFNAALLGLQTDPDFAARYGVIADRLDRLILSVFVFEILLRILAHGRAFFRFTWSWFDMAVVLLSFAPASEGLSILRALRVLRLLRLLSVVPKMRRVIGGFFAAIPGMAGVVGVLSVVFYVSAVITTSVFGQTTLETAAAGATAEDVETVKELFGSLGSSFFTLFQLMTLEDWAGGIVKPTLAVYPDAMWFFGPYIVITSFAVLNLFIGIIVDAMQDERDDEAELALLAREHESTHEAAPTEHRPKPPAASSAAEAGLGPDVTDLLLSEIRHLRNETRRLADLAESARADADELMARDRAERARREAESRRDPDTP